MTPIEQNIINSLKFLSKEGKELAIKELGAIKDNRTKRVSKKEKFKGVSLRTKFF